LSSSEPNLQNIPKELSEEDIINVKEIFIPEKGYSFISADYSGQELRQTANITKDENLIATLLKNKDIHLSIVNKWFDLGIPEKSLYESDADYKFYKNKYKDKRDKLKIAFPILYGVTAYGLSLRTKVTEEEAQKGMDSFFELFPRIKPAMQRCNQELLANHCVKNYFGRKRRFGEIDKHSVRQGFNFLIQGFCADMLRLVLVNITELYCSHPEWGSRLVLTVHDSVVSEVKDEYAEICLQETKRIMESTINFEVPFLVDIKLCKNYGD
jgi:DNA polymerase-1